MMIVQQLALQILEKSLEGICPDQETHSGGVYFLSTFPGLQFSYKLSFYRLLLHQKNRSKIS